ncbi:Pyridoxal-5'-phosphate-dependent protein beta subunit [Kitasatospora sp. MMS16-BH015]|uniref:threonine synthase n=1 Tax=Kitasatospora sp. MMS16-BH015 TaxID=2018025 RepID=UPI000CA2914E|nr:PLP-dependent lyase/thiolase [Kitasatospora sp. MMS16-BH015]AUG78798.1 Pyridoxal-5'-phosphate-dependent protein beta subunit [Kitasatospora sp. MMS16-BH015]
MAAFAPLSPALTGLECVRCAARYPVEDHPRGCPACHAAGQSANLYCRYAEGTPLAQRLPYPGAWNFGVGPTPLTARPGLPEVLVKNEAISHTGSHKDRFAAQVVAHAVARGYRAVAVGSSGNAGYALAAHAAAAGLACVVAAFNYLPESTRAQLECLGADLRLFEEDGDRLRCIADLADDPAVLTVSSITDPVTGSHCIGIEGYKQIAWELAEQHPADLHHVVVPSSRGDLAWGIHLGFQDLQELTGRPAPRLHLVEPIPRLAAVLAGSAGLTDRFPGDIGRLHSIGGDTTTHQAHRAVVAGGGTALVVTDHQADLAFRRLTGRGQVWERSSATVFAAYEALRADGTVRAGEQTALVATSHLFKGL